MIMIVYLMGLAFFSGIFTVGITHRYYHTRTEYIFCVATAVIWPISLIVAVYNVLKSR
jgi:hypothetical protein